MACTCSWSRIRGVRRIDQIVQPAPRHQDDAADGEGSRAGQATSTLFGNPRPIRPATQLRASGPGDKQAERGGQVDPVGDGAHAISSHRAHATLRPKRLHSPGSSAKNWVGTPDRGVPPLPIMESGEAEWPSVAGTRRHGTRRAPTGNHWTTNGALPLMPKDFSQDHGKANCI